MPSFDPNKLLPKNICIGRNEDHLYRIGLCLTTETNAKRNAFHRPGLVFLMNLSFLIKNLICIRLKDEDKDLLLLYGDFSHFIGIRWHFNIACAFYTGFAIFMQLIHFYNHLKGIKPNYLNVIQMMSGRRTPKSIGLIDEKQIIQMTQTTKKVFLLARLNTQITIPVFSFCMAFVLFYFYCSLSVTLTTGILGALHYAWACYYVYSIHVFEVIYFNVICGYIEIKIKSENQRIKSLVNFGRVGQKKLLIDSLKSLNSIYSEIISFDDNFWAKFLFFVWVMYGNVIVLSLFMLFFSPMSAINRIGFSYLLAIILITFLFVMNTAASINLTVFRSYRDLNNLMAIYGSNLLIRKGLHYTSNSLKV